MECRHCKANLDGEDIFEFFFKMYNNVHEALKIAKLYGWSSTSKIHFSRAIIIQPDKKPQYEICPDCKSIL